MKPVVVKKFVLIVAGGHGTRMNAAVPKQFLLINNLPVLMHTLKIFRRYDKAIQIILALPEKQIPVWEQLCIEHKFKIEHKVQSGGETRFHTVRKNLEGIPDDAFIAVHDGVRPLVSLSTIERCFEAAATFGNAVPCVGIPETLRKIDEKGSLWVDRTKYRLVQTPQVFYAPLLKEAYKQEYNTSFTDDAGVVESKGCRIHLVEGNIENIKITFEKDLLIASAFMSTTVDTR